MTRTHTHVTLPVTQREVLTARIWIVPAAVVKRLRTLTHTRVLIHTYIRAHMIVIQVHCTRCGRDSHTEEQCYAIETVDGFLIRDSDSEQDED
jgi:hypothetical protein